MFNPTPLALPVAEVGKILDVPTQTINGWRNDGLLSELGSAGKGRTGARRYSLGDIFVLAVMRHLTEGPAGLSAPMAALLAKRCRTMLLDELAGRAPAGRFLVLETGFAGLEHVITAADLPGFVARWATEKPMPNFVRLEIFDFREVAVRVLTKVTCLEGQGLDGATEDQARAQVEIAFEERATAYLRDEIEASNQASADAAQRSE